jgi:membrane-associated phospholipid phosphatase
VAVLDGSQQTPRSRVRRRIVDRRARVTVGCMMLLGALFVGLAIMLRAAGGTAVDVAITRAVQRIDVPGFTPAMVAISALGYAPLSWYVMGGIVVALLALRLYREVPFVLATEAVSTMVAAIKLLVERPRPIGESIRVTSTLLDYSFPSGHVVTYVCLYGFLFFLVYVRFNPSVGRTAALWVLGLVVGLVGLSRVYLGYHWASDVLGGYALGTLCLLALVEAYRLLVIRPWSDDLQSSERDRSRSVPDAEASPTP